MMTFLFPTGDELVHVGTSKAVIPRVCWSMFSGLIRALLTVFCFFFQKVYIEKKSSGLSSFKKEIQSTVLLEEAGMVFQGSMKVYSDITPCDPWDPGYSQGFEKKGWIMIAQSFIDIVSTQDISLNFALFLIANETDNFYILEISSINVLHRYRVNYLWNIDSKSAHGLICPI